MKKIIALDISHNQLERITDFIDEIISATTESQFVIHDNYPISLDELKEYSTFVIVQPDRSLFETGEARAILEFVESGGNLLLLGNAGGDHAHLSNFSQEILSQFGVKFNEDRMIDHQKSVDQNPSIFLIADVKDHPIFLDVKPQYSNGCSIKLTEPRGKILASKDNNPIMVEIHQGLGKVIIIGSYMMFKISENMKFFFNLMDYFLGKLKQEAPAAPKFKFSIPSKLSKDYKDPGTTSELDEIQVTDQDFDKVIDRIHNMMKKFSLLKDFTRIKKVKNYFLKVEGSIRNIVKSSDESDQNKFKIQLKNSFENLFQEFLNMDVTHEEKELISNFQDMFDELGMMLKKRFNLILSEEVASKSKIEIEIDKVKKQINSLEYQKNELSSNKIYLSEQFQKKLITQDEYEFKLNNIEFRKKEFDEQISYLKGRMKLLSSI